MERAVAKRRFLLPMSFPHWKWKTRKSLVYKIIFPVLVFLLIFCENCSGAIRSLPEDYFPQIQILEIISSPTNRSSAANLWKKRNSDIIIGEDTSATSRILMKCNATYPVQWVYLGDGRPEFTTFTNVRWQEDPEAPMSFEAEASLGLLGFQGVLREVDTGNYTCRSIQDPTVHSYYFIYVPGDDLFAATNGTEIAYSPKNYFVRIPCGVSHPDVSVTLCKRDRNNKLTCPVPGASAFNNKGGFLLNMRKQRDPSGTYVCTANHRRNVRIVEHHLIKEGDKPKRIKPIDPPPTEIKPPKLGKNLCDPSPCGKQADCSVVDGRAVCYCFRGLNGNPFDECVPGKCRSSRDCPRGKFCRQGQCTSDPCNPSPCGKGGECSISRGQSKCSCQSGYTGLPPNCVKSCNVSIECNIDEACIKGICQSPCPGPCGQNAECRVLSRGPQRTAQCSCPKDFIGDPLKSCYKFNSTTPPPWNSCPPGYVGQPPACSKKECDSDLDCPFGRKCTENLCEKGFNPSCNGKCGRNAECRLSPTTSDPICVCPEGSFGNPTVFCTTSPLSPSDPAPPPTSWGDPCHPNPCQAPAECHMIQGNRQCVCPPGFTGNPTNCIPATRFPPPPGSTGATGTGGGCRYDADCRQGENCIEGQCIDLCKGLCGYNAVCEPAYLRKYRSIYTNGKLLRSQTPEGNCRCRNGYEGNPYVSCNPSRTPPPASPALPSATTSIEPSCYAGACGRFAECSIENNAPVCRCPPGLGGNPYSECREIEKSPPPPPTSQQDEHSSTQPRPPSSLPTQPRPPPSGPPTHFSPVDLDFQGHSWGHHPGLDTRDREPPPPPPSRGRPPSPTQAGQDYFEGGNRFHSRPPPSLDTLDSINQERPYPPQPPPPPYDHDDRDFHAGKVDNGPPTRQYPPGPTLVLHVDRSYPPNPTTLQDDRRFSPGADPTKQYQEDHRLPSDPTAPYFPPDPTAFLGGETPPPKTLQRPMSPLGPEPGSGPVSPRDNDRDECSFKNPYADYDMESCGVGRRCERDFRGIKRCVCISPFDCTGPTSVYLGGRCKTTRDCLLSDHICSNGTCVNPCSPEYSPCAGIAYAECRVIEGNVLCTCRRGYYGNPASGLDCRPKRYAAASSSVVPASVAVAAVDRDERDFVMLNGKNTAKNSSGEVSDFHAFVKLSNNTTNLKNSTDEDYSSSGNSGSGGSSAYDDDDEDSVIISSGSANTRHHRRHDGSLVGKSITNEKNDLFGQCGFGSGHYCDERSHCRVISGRPMCVCKSGYQGKYPDCKPECEKNEDCPESMACQYLQCLDPCIEEKLYCAANAFCTVSNHTARCECQKPYIGVPWIQCSKPEVAAKNRCMGFNCKKRNAKV